MPDASREPYLRLAAAILLRAIRDVKRGHPQCHAMSASRFLISGWAEQMMDQFDIDRSAVLEELGITDVRPCTRLDAMPGGFALLI